MLENTIENGERPLDLIIYGGTGQALRNWACFDATTDALVDLASDETLLIQSGKPVARFRTTPDSPRVLVSTAQLVPRWATWKHFHKLEALGLTMYGQYTAGSWAYIGRQGVLQSTYETLAECAKQHFNGSLAGRLVLTSGLGAMGSAQPKAVKLLGGVAIVCEVDERKMAPIVNVGYLDRWTNSAKEAIELAQSAVREKCACTVGLVGNAGEVLPALAAAALRPDIVTDQTSAHDLLHGYVPVGVSVAEAAKLRSDDPAEYEARALATVRLHVAAMLEFQTAGSVVFEYGNAIREQAQRAGLESAFDFAGFVPLFIRPHFSVGRGPCRWVALSGEEQDIHVIDEAILEDFAGEADVTSWIRIAMTNVPHQGLPARTSWLAYEQRGRVASLINRLVADGTVKAPVAMSRDHLDAGSVAQPTRETESMLDGSDAIADWPVLNALLNTAAGADLVALHQGAGSGMGGSISAGMTVVLDGTQETQHRIDRVFKADPGIGVIRHADAGYASALRTVRESDLVAPMLGVSDEGA